MRLQDGKGRNGEAAVSSDQRLDVNSKSADRIYYKSRDDGLAFNAVYDGITAAAGDYVSYLKNTSTTRNLHVSTIEYHSSQNAKWLVWSVTGTADSGESITPTNLNLSSGVSAEVTAMAGNTPISGLTAVSKLGTHRSQAESESEMDYRGALILGPGDAIAVEYDSGGTGDVTIDTFFWYETIGV